jgi:large subunit ribosomal protein L14
MIQQKTLLKIIDNSNIKIARCIKKKSDFVLVSIFQKEFNINIKKGSLFSAIIIREKKVKTKKNGSFFYFEENSIILLNSKNGLLGTRFFGCIPSKLRKKKLLKVLCLTLTLI